MKFLFLIFLLPLQLCAQDITGVWTGTLYNDTTKQYLKYELAISEYDGKLSGYSHTIFVIDGVENIGVKSIKIKKSGNKLFIEDDKLIYNNYTGPPAKGVRLYSDLVLSQDDSSVILSGPWKTNTTKVYRSITGNILLKKKRKIEETLIIPKLENLGLNRSLSFMPDESRRQDVAIINTSVSNADNSFKEKISPGSEKPQPGTQGTIVQKASESAPDTKGNAKDEAKKTNNPATVKSETVQKKEDTTVVLKEKTSTEHGLLKDVNKNKREISSDSLIVAVKKPVTKNEVNISLINQKIPTSNLQEKPAQKLNDTISYKKNIEAIKPGISQFPKAAADISSRKIETIKSVDIKNDSLLLTLYDNGEIDGDTVSVLLNGKVIMPMQGLTANGINKTIYLTPEMGDSIVLIMYAENLGSIPPNTGLLIVHDGDARHEIWFTGDLHENAAIILRRKKKT